jgi:hypothetical protein
MNEIKSFPKLNTRFLLLISLFILLVIVLCYWILDFFEKKYNFTRGFGMGLLSGTNFLLIMFTLNIIFITVSYFFMNPKPKIQLIAMVSQTIFTFPCIYIFSQVYYNDFSLPIGIMLILVSSMTIFKTYRWLKCIPNSN